LFHIVEHLFYFVEELLATLGFNAVNKLQFLLMRFGVLFEESLREMLSEERLKNIFRPYQSKDLHYFFKLCPSNFVKYCFVLVEWHIFLHLFVYKDGNIPCNLVRLKIRIEESFE